MNDRAAPTKIEVSKEVSMGFVLYELLDRAVYSYLRKWDGGKVRFGMAGVIIKG